MRAGKRHVLKRAALAIATTNEVGTKDVVVKTRRVDDGGGALDGLNGQ